jgi:HD superfamily phosphohydrolase
MPEGHKIRDPVHNFLVLGEEEMKLVGTPLFQRLRGIRQLAMANLVYPGALHTRFDHSLGVCHVAGLLSRQLDLVADERRLVSVAALLHDLGHGPFSHVSESLLERYADRSSLPNYQKKEKIHELVTAHLIGNDPRIRDIVGRDTCETVVKLLSTGHGQPALRSIVSGPLDADKQDYLLRDSRFCGVEYGIFDIHQLHRSLMLHGDDDEKALMIAPDGVHAVEQYVLAKYFMTTNVYSHRVRLITDQMLIRAIVLGIEVDGLEELRKVYAFDNSSEFFEQYIAWDDARLFMRFGADSEPKNLCESLLQRLRQRRLFKSVFSEKAKSFGPEIASKILNIGKREHDETRRRVELASAEILCTHFKGEVKPQEVIVHGFDIKSVRTSSRNDESAMLVRKNPPVPFEEESSLFASINESYSDGYVQVYAPVVWPDRTQKAKRMKELKEPIRQAIESIAGSSQVGAP